MINKDSFGEILERDFAVNPEEIEKALKYKEQYGGKLGEILLHSGIISEEQIAAVLAKQFSFKNIKDIIRDLPNLHFEPLKDINPQWFLTNGIIPLIEENHKMFFLLKDPFNLYGCEVVEHLYLDSEIEYFLADDRGYREISNLFSLKYKGSDDTVFDSSEIEKLRDLAEEAPIIKFVNSMLTRAAEYRASDIHLENQQNILKIRNRIDGVLHDIDTIPQEMAKAVISRIKIMTNLDIGEKRLPQDGRMDIKIAGKLFDIRVSTVPSIHGENIVLRLLEKENIDFTIDLLGLTEPDRGKVGKLIANNYGLILLTGPTGSGKSTTLYSILNILNTKEKKIITVEDPVEYEIEGVTQIHVKESIDLSFENILRNILRQDPDIIMIGEIRDKKTAEIAIQASLTGHLVFATLHTNDSVSAITRLKDIGVDEYLINSSLLGIIAQRLVRRVCNSCGREIQFDSDKLEGINIKKMIRDYRIEPVSTRENVGCEACAFTGFKGRIGIYEILNYSNEIKKMVIRDEGYEEIFRFLEEREFKTLRHDAIIKYLTGITTIEEVYRVT